MFLATALRRLRRIADSGWEAIGTPSTTALPGLYAKFAKTVAPFCAEDIVQPRRQAHHFSLYCLQANAASSAEATTTA